MYRGFIIFITEDWLPIIENLIQSVLLFSKHDIEVYCIGFQYDFKNTRIKNNQIQLNHLHFFNITKCKILASVNTLFDYALILDGDMIVTPDIDKIFEENEERIHKYDCPLFVNHPNNPFKRYSEIISSITKKTPKMGWVYSNYLFIRKQIWFLREVLDRMDAITDYSFYYPVPEEGIINALLTEYEVDYNLGYIYFTNGYLSTVDSYLYETKQKLEQNIDNNVPLKLYAFHGHDIRQAHFGKQILEKIQHTFYSKKKVISYSLWGEKPIYTIGAIYCAKEAAEIYPDFECWFYIHEETVPKKIVEELATFSNVKIIFKTGDITTVKPMMWRFLAIDDPEVEVMMSRDTDTRFTHREKLAVDEWLNSDALFHIMRDHPHHIFSILGGMFGTRKLPEIISWKQEMEKVSQTGTHQYDQTFLKDTIYDIVKEKAMIHANFHRIESNCRYFPTEYDPTFRFVGEYVNYDNTRIPDHIYSLKDEYYKYCSCPIHIISTFYISTYFVEKDAERNQELKDCLLNNLLSPTVEKIHLFVDDQKCYQKLLEIAKDHLEKIEIIAIGIRPKYSDFFTYILQKLPNQICMISNADIYIDTYELKILNSLRDCKWVYALTRYECDLSKPLITNYTGSHDAYIFNSAFLSDKIISKYTDLYQNQPGIETCILHNFYEFGFTIYNPCLQIKIVHLHRSDVRNYQSEWIGLHEQGNLEEHKQMHHWIPPISFL